MNVLKGINQKRVFRNILCNSRPRLYRMAYSWTHNPALADDLVQQTCLKALRNQRSLRDMEAADSWLFRILANCLSDHYRTHREVLSGEELVAIDSRTPERSAREEQVARRVRRAVASLPLPHRQVITLVDLEGFAYATVAQILDIPVGTVMSRLSRGRRALRERLADERIQEGVETSPRVRRIK
jgi:RNA polymerase sigma-70 factor (ECF subfamily)